MFREGLEIMPGKELLSLSTIQIYVLPASQKRIEMKQKKEEEEEEEEERRRRRRKKEGRKKKKKKERRRKKEEGRRRRKRNCGSNKNPHTLVSG